MGVGRVCSEGVGDCMDGGSRLTHLGRIVGLGLKTAQSGSDGGEVVRNSISPRANMIEWVFPAPGLCYKYVQAFIRLCLPFVVQINPLLILVKSI